MDMTADALRQICKENNLYQTPELNETLFCSLKGFKNIADLERYTDLKALFLDGNALQHLEGIPILSKLRCLYLQNNVLSDLRGLDRLPSLEALNVSNNQLEDLSALKDCETLQTLLCSHNNLTSFESLAFLQTCPALSTVDLQDNDLDDTKVVEIFAEMLNLRCLYLKGNPVVEKIKNYRKTLISRIPSLTYLDDRPIFEVERRCAEAWARGGLEAERSERQQVQAEEAERHKQEFERLQRIRSEGFRKRRGSLGMPEGDTDPFQDTLSEKDIQREELPPELVAAEARLAQLQANKAADMKESNNAEEWNPMRMGEDDDDIIDDTADIIINPLQPWPALHNNVLLPIKSAGVNRQHDITVQPMRRTAEKSGRPSAQQLQYQQKSAVNDDALKQGQAFIQELNACTENMAL